MESTGLARFLFELASEERLGILAAISEKPLRHAQIARRGRMTGCGPGRHLNRLTAAGLVTKGPQSEYVPTNLARLVSADFPFFSFLLAYREFLLNHDVLVLPPGFVERLGALSGGVLTKGTYNVVATQERSLRSAKRRIWVLSEQAFEQALPILREKASGGADVRVIRPRQVFQDPVPLSAVKRNYPLRLLGEARVVLAVVDDVAGGWFPNPPREVHIATIVFLHDCVGSALAGKLL